MREVVTVPKRRAKGEGTIYFDEAKKRWIGAIRAEGEKVTSSGRSYQEARTRLNEKLRKRELGVQGGHGNMTVSQLLDHWFQRDLVSRNRAPNTIDSHRWAIGHLNGIIGSRRLRDLTPDVIEPGFDVLAADGLSRSSLVKIRNTLSQALDFGVRRGYVARNAARDMHLPLDATRPSEKRFLTAEEVKRLFKVLDTERLGAMYATAVTLGVRPGELAGLKWAAVDFEKCTINVIAASRRHGSRHLVGDDLKNPTATRTLKVPAIVIDLLARHRTRQHLEILGSEAWPHPELVFVSRVGTVLHPSNVRREFRRVLDRAQVSKVTPNELRHTASTLMYDAGVSRDAIADVLGHTSTRMLDKTYRHRTGRAIEDAAIVMDNLLEGTA